MSKKDYEDSTAHNVLKYAAFPSYQVCLYVVKSLRSSKKKSYFEEADRESINVANGFHKDILVRVDTAIVDVSDVKSTAL